MLPEFLHPTFIWQDPAHSRRHKQFESRENCERRFFLYLGRAAEVPEASQLEAAEAVLRRPRQPHPHLPCVAVSLQKAELQHAFLKERPERNRGAVARGADFARKLGC